MYFSQRNGHSAIPTQLLPNSMPKELRNSLWNEFDAWLESQELYDVVYAYWKHYFREPVDQIPYSSGYDRRSYLPARAELRTRFFSVIWHEVYSMLEFAFKIDRRGLLAKHVNAVMQREITAYRVINNQFIPVTDDMEISALSEALCNNDKFSPVSTHISSALALLSNRQQPDFRNSIKESISAVEAMARILCNNNHATLGDALAVLNKTHNLHGALEKGFSALYGYTSNADGIRHGLMDEPNLSANDATYFLLSCSSFVNYLKTHCNQ